MSRIGCPQCSADISLVTFPSESQGYFISDADVEAWSERGSAIVRDRLPADFWGWLRDRRQEGHCMVAAYRCPYCGHLWADANDRLARGAGATEER